MSLVNETDDKRETVELRFLELEEPLICPSSSPRPVPEVGEVARLARGCVALRGWYVVGVAGDFSSTGSSAGLMILRVM